MKVTFWGVRGSFPASLPPYLRYGGNTPCLEVDTGSSTILIDAGTGIRAAGKSLGAHLHKGGTHAACGISSQVAAASRGSSGMAAFCSSWIRGSKEGM